jgi:hypothetical protein
MNAFLDRIDAALRTYLRMIGRTLHGAPDADDSPPPILDPDSPFGPKDDLVAELDADLARAADTQIGPADIDRPRRSADDDDDDDDDRLRANGRAAPKAKAKTIKRRPLPPDDGDRA